MADRKHISCTYKVWLRCNNLKRDNESWTDFLDRAADALESEKTDSGEDGNGPETLTPEHIDDIAAEVERRVERALQNRLTSR